MNHVFESIPPREALRIIIIESEKQAGKLTIDGVVAYCMVTPDGSVSYYQKKEVS